MIFIAWKNAFAAIWRNFSVFLAAFVAVLIIEAVMLHYSPPGRFVYHHGPHPHRVPVNLHVVTIDLISSLFTSIAVAPCMVAVHRYVLLKTNENLFGKPRRLVYFAAWLCLFHVIPGLPVYLQTIPGWPVLLVVAYFFMVRLVLAFPSIALDTSMPFHDSWKRTKGHFWVVAGTMIFCLLPILLLMVAITDVLTPQLSEVGFFGYNSLARVVLLAAFGATVIPAVGAALASELYLEFGGLKGETQEST